MSPKIPLYVQKVLNNKLVHAVKFGAESNVYCRMSPKNLTYSEREKKYSEKLFNFVKNPFLNF